METYCASCNENTANNNSSARKTRKIQKTPQF